MCSFPGWGRSAGEENGNPLQYSCLGNPTHRGAWWATVHRVAKSQTQLSMHTCHLPKPDPVISLLHTGQECHVYSYKKVLKSLCIFLRLPCGIPSSLPSCLTPLPALCSTLSVFFQVFVLTLLSSVTGPLHMLFSLLDTYASSLCLVNSHSTHCFL